jgi:hypothetical protein
LQKVQRDFRAMKSESLMLPAATGPGCGR